MNIPQAKIHKSEKNSGKVETNSGNGRKNSENSKMTHKLGIKTQKTGKKTQEMVDKNSENVQKRENIEALYERLKISNFHVILEAILKFGRRQQEEHNIIEQIFESKDQIIKLNLLKRQVLTKPNACCQRKYQLQPSSPSIRGKVSEQSTGENI